MPEQELVERLTNSVHGCRLPAKDYLRHLCRHASSIPELLDEACLIALRNVEAQYGELQSYLAMLEVRLGCPERNIDYILCMTDGSPVPQSAIWLEMDYSSFCGLGNITPCLFLIQTTISHYKLVYEDGKVTGAKAYLQQTPYPLHRLYPKD